MKAITFEQFIQTFNFRYYRDDVTSEKDRMDTVNIRIYPYSEPRKNDYWFEFGAYDYGIPNAWQIASKVLNDKILKSYIETIQYDTDLGCVQVWLQKEKEFID